MTVGVAPADRGRRAELAGDRFDPLHLVELGQPRHRCPRAVAKLPALASHTCPMRPACLAARRSSPAATAAATVTAMARPPHRDRARGRPTRPVTDRRPCARRSSRGGARTEPGEPIRDRRGRAGLDGSDAWRHPASRTTPTTRAPTSDAPGDQHEAVDVHPASHGTRPPAHADREPGRQADRHGDGDRGGPDGHRQRPDQIGHHQLAAADAQRAEEAPVSALRAKLAGTCASAEQERRHDGDRERERQRAARPSEADLTVHRLAAPRTGCRPRSSPGTTNARSPKRSATSAGEVVERHPLVRGRPP